MISIVVPTYNSSETIKTTIESILNQSFQNWELIIVDDCSEDNTTELIQEYIARDERVNLYKNKENSGAGFSRNYGILKAKYNYIAFCDSDDEWDRRKLEFQLNLLEEGCQFVTCGYDRYINNQFLGTISCTANLTLEKYLKTTCIGLSTVILHKSILDVHKFTMDRTRQDTILWIKILKSGIKVATVDKSLVRYNVRKNSISSNKLKAALKVFKVYSDHTGLKYFKIVQYFTCYLLNNIKRRIL